jgi:hypothetical protein
VNRVQAEVGAVGRAALGVSVKPAMISGSLAAIGPGTVGVDSGQLSRLGARQGGTLVLRVIGAGAALAAAALPARRGARTSVVSAMAEA